MTKAELKESNARAWEGYQRNLKIVDLLRRGLITEIEMVKLFNRGISDAS